MKLSAALLLLFLGIAAFQNQVSCEEDADYLEDDGGMDEDDEEGPPPKLLSKGGHIQAKPGDTLTLDCDVQNGENAVIQWRRSPDIPVYFDNTRQVKDTRFSRDAKFALHIKEAQEKDAGEYSCEILGTQQKIHYVIEFKFVDAPKILRMVPEGENKVLMKGNPLTLMCEATGDPKPKIYWTHKKKHHKEEILEDETLTYDQVSRKTSGTYTCTAENEKGKDQKSINIEVHYEPEIELQKEIVNSAEGYESELACIVHAHPSAKVTWFKEDKAVRESHHSSQINEGNLHILRISNTKNSDFGTYKCSARNEIGSQTKTVILSGLPSKPTFVSANVAEDSKSPVLTWKVNSHSPIQLFELMYKKQQDDKWDTTNPSIHSDGINTYVAKHTLRNLEPGTYVAQIRAKNVYGWSTISEVKSFSGDVIGESAMQSNYLESSTSGSCSLEMRISIVFIFSLLVARLMP